MSESDAAVPAQPASFGEELRRERELRQISLREVAEATKINLRFLEALENNDFDMLPGGFFVRGFIKSYARHIGINEEAMVNAYLLEAKQQRSRLGAAPAPAAPGAAATPLAPASEPPAPRPAARAQGSGARGITVGASFLAFCGLAFLLWNGVRQLGEGAARGSAPEEAPEAAPASDSQAAIPASAAMPESLKVELVLRRRSWVRVLCDGREMVNRTLDTGARRTFECEEEVTLSAAEAAALQVSLNGRLLEIPGAPGERLTPLVVRRREWPPAQAISGAEEPQ
jgi:cytoskeletal protein RodZ